MTNNYEFNWNSFSIANVTKLILDLHISVLLIVCQHFMKIIGAAMKWMK